MTLSLLAFWDFLHFGVILLLAPSNLHRSLQQATERAILRRVSNAVLVQVASRLPAARLRSRLAPVVSTDCDTSPAQSCGKAMPACAMTSSLGMLFPRTLAGQTTSLTALLSKLSDFRGAWYSTVCINGEPVHLKCHKTSDCTSPVIPVLFAVSSFLLN